MAHARLLLSEEPPWLQRKRTDSSRPRLRSPVRFAAIHSMSFAQRSYYAWAFIFSAIAVFCGALVVFNQELPAGLATIAFNLLGSACFLASAKERETAPKQASQRPQD